MFVAVLFVPAVAGNIFLESDFRRLPKISERTRPLEKRYMLFDPCKVDVADDRDVNCAQIRRKGHHLNAVYHIYLPKLVRVKCDMQTNGGGWTVIQRRGKYENVNENLFEKNKDYEHEFGDVEVSNWIGNENIHRLTNFPNKKQVLRIELLTQAGDSITVEYDDFKVGSKADDYRLSIGKYNGTPGYNALQHYNGRKFFIAEDRYTSTRPGCYPPLSGGWWFHECVRSNLNGRKFKSTDKKNKKGLGITWAKDNDPNSYDVVYDQVEMKIRDADFDFCTGNKAK